MADHFPIGVDANSLTGKLLVATPKLENTMFSKTVILLFDHGTRTGAQGLVVNRMSKQTTVSRLIDDPGLSNSPMLDVPVYHGGPVAERTITMLHSSEWFSSNTRVINSDFSMSSDKFMLEKISSGNAPIDWMITAGKCGWVPGQLENEIASGAWLTLTAKPAIVFSTGEVSLWKLCIELCASETMEQFFS
jgi:putative transcriptional regulator